MLQLVHVTSAPRWMSVSMSTAVCTVMWRHPAMRAPASGFAAPYSARKAMSPGISLSAILISFCPHSASEMSFTLKWSAMMFRLSSVRGHTLRLVFRFELPRGHDLPRQVRVGPPAAHPVGDSRDLGLREPRAAGKPRQLGRL